MIRFKAFAFTFLLFVCSIFITALALEAWLALAQINTKSYGRHVPGKGGTYMPGAYYRHTKEGFSEGYFNSHGFRDYERTYKKEPNSFRILVLGDSYVEALQVALQNSFPALLEKRLNEGSNSIEFEVLNLGQSGFGTVDEYMRYLNFGVEYSPDLVIVAFLTGNDFQDNSKFLNHQPKFYFVFDDHGNLVLDRSLFEEYEKSLTLAKRAFQAIKRQSYLASLISERLYLLRVRLQDDFYRSLLARHEPTGSGARLDPFSSINIYSTSMSEHWKEAFAITAGILRKFKHTVESNGSGFVLVTLSNAEQVHPEMQQTLKEKYGNAIDFEQPDRFIEEVAKREHIEYLKLMPTFREYHLRTGKYLHGFGDGKGGHWNEDGHRLAAEKIFEFLTEKQLVTAVTAQNSHNPNGFAARASATPPLQQPELQQCRFSRQISCL